MSIEQKPSVGRVVHYVSTASTQHKHLCAHVCDVPDASESVNLRVFSLDGESAWGRTNVPHDEERKAPGTWHWPERV